MNFNDDIFRSIQEFIEANQHKYASIDETIAAFMEQHNEAMAKESQSSKSRVMSKEEESMMLLQEAQFEQSRTERRKLLKRALKLWPDNFEAEMLLVEGDYMKQLEAFARIEKREHAKWLKTDQVGWINWQERPYWRLKHAYADFLFEIGLLTEAEKHYEESIAVNEMDNLGARYGLMSVYARTYQWDKAKSLFDQIPIEIHDDMLVVPMLCLAVLTQRYDFAHDLMESLKAMNPDLRQFFQGETIPIELIMASGDTLQYQMDSIESLSAAFYPLIPMLFGADYVYQWLKKAFLSPKRKTKPTKKINFAKETDIIEFPASRTKSADPLEGLMGQARNILEAAGLTTFAAFEKVTEKEVASMKGIGPRTMRILKDTQVTFRK